MTATLAPKRREQQTQSLNAVLPPGPTLWVGLSTRAGNLAEIDRNRGIQKGAFGTYYWTQWDPQDPGPPGGFVGFTQQFVDDFRHQQSKSCLVKNHPQLS